MRIRIFQAFASNNSGSYTIVGRFREAAVAEEIAGELQTVLAEHAAWIKEHGDYTKAGTTPLEAFAKARGLSEGSIGREDDWPESYADPPSALAVGSQVLVHAPYTVTMPRLFGEYVYKRGGRVDVEMNHAHEPLVATFTLWVRGAGWGNAEARAKLESLGRDLEPRLEPFLKTYRDGDERPVVRPVFQWTHFECLALSVILGDLVAGADVVRKAAAERGVDVELRLREADEGIADPFAALR
jgi:hypothetical protein